MSQNVDVIRGVYAAFARGDVPAVLGAMDPQVEWTEAEGFPYPGTFVGPDAVLQGVFAPLGTEWDGYKVEPSEILDAGDAVVGLGHYSGRYKATGKEFRAPFAHVFRLKDGKIVGFVQYTDTALIQTALQE
ncbi:MAG: nuclear transport factor 2 family protein [Dehalococcoidia bacterium]